MIRKLISTLRYKQNLLIFMALSAITLIGARFRFYQIGKQPLWLDEAFSVWMGRHSIPDIINLTIDIDQHPPFYHLLLHVWMSLGGYSEAWSRSLSALFGILTIIVIYYLGKTLSGWFVGLLAALVLALSPFHIQFGQETRTYTLLTLCASISMWMTARLMVDARTHTQPIGQQLKNFFLHGRQRWNQPAGQDLISGTGPWNKFRMHKSGFIVRAESICRSFQELETDLTWIGYMVFTALTVYSHNTAIFLPLGINLFVFGLMLFRRFYPTREGQFRPPSLKNWMIAQIGVFLIWSPWLLPFYRQASGVANDFWIQPPTVGIVLLTFGNFLLADIPAQIRWQLLIWVGFGGAFGLALRSYRGKVGHFIFLAALFLTPFLGELLVSLRWPIFYDRTLIWCTIPLYVLIAVGISQLRYRPYILTAVIILVTLNGLSVGNFFATNEKERWDLATTYLNGKMQAGDIIIFNSNWSEIPFDYYFARYHRKVEEFGVPETMFENGVLEPRMTAADLPRLDKIINGRKRVWLVYSHNWWTDPKFLIQNALSKQMKLIDIKNFNGMQLQLYGGK